MEIMDRVARLKRLRFRAWHRGTRETDLLVGGFFDRDHQQWDEAEVDWFERLLEEQDVDILAWAIGAAEPPPPFQGAMMARLRKLDFIHHPD